MKDKPLFRFPGRRLRTAICISGQPRNVEAGLAFIKPNILDHNNEADVFIHVWWDDDVVGKRLVNAGGHVASDTIRPATLEYIESSYQPLVMQFEPQRQFDEKNYNERKWPGITPFYSLSQRYSIWRSHELRREHEEKRGFKYDVVMKLRFDWACYSPIVADDFDPSVMNTPDRNPHLNGIDDTFAISSSENMDVYSELFFRLDEYYNEDQIDFCDELLLYHHLKKNGIRTVTHPFPYDLLRG